ncbi:MAG: hypothetical protein EG822_02185 [Deltaproteobacteria bacterium]|nr:hypothetical protein [Deltaproteobacteria bacterium]TLN04324.1 MAG: hypothetical protein FDZ73_04080 [bacterium]
MFPSCSPSGVNAVDARELHKALGVKDAFAHWIKEQIVRAMLVDGIDYVVSAEKGKNPKGGRPSKDYLISLDAAKQVCMMSATTSREPSPSESPSQRHTQAFVGLQVAVAAYSSSRSANR